ncbi:MAG: DNA repair exonuclease [Pirellulales bacterium]
MSGELIRFLHASDFHLEQPLYGLSSVPEHLRELALEAPYLAATRVFDNAILEHVDFVVLSGDILDPFQAGPRGLAFLLEQFQRLADRSIEVYWSGGRSDSPEAWPATVPLPPNVTYFGTGKLEERTQVRHEASPATLLGISWTDRLRIHPSEFRCDTSDRFKIAVVHGEFDAGTLVRQNIQYWALGGEHQRKTLYSTPYAAHYPGSPQGRCGDEPGPHGCTLVSVDPDGKARLQAIPTDVIRWHDERLVISEAITKADLQRLLRDRMQALVAEVGDRALLVNWRLEANGRIASSLRHGGLADDLATELRTEYGHRRHPAWTVAVEVEPPTSLPVEWYEEDSILGDFLRSVRDHEQGKSEPLRLSSYLTDEQAAGAFGRALEIADPAARARLMRQAAVRGVDMLRGELVGEN